MAQNQNANTILPPDEILNPPLGNTPDYEFIILWMLNHNESCEWSDFTPEISISTLSRYLNLLMNKEYVIKPQRNQYEITFEGRKRYAELSKLRESGEPSLRYPPNTITRTRNYDDIILWMLYNNESCRWSDFKDEPLQINQSSLSKNLNLLMSNDLIVNENKEYKITPKGKSEYLELLRKYDLDRQSILEEESKRIEEITTKTKQFFRKYNITNDDVKFRFLNNHLKFDYEKVKSHLKGEEFDKVLLFLSMNHPDQFPKYISAEKFSKIYQIDPLTLSFYVKEITEKNFFENIQYFKLEDKQDHMYYFQADEKVERVLRAIVEDYITRTTYLNKLNDSDYSQTQINIDEMLSKILNEVCRSIFDTKLGDALKSFLPEYIEYLAYKLESEVDLLDNSERIGGVAFQSVFEEFQTFQASTIPFEPGEEETYYYLDGRIFQSLDSFKLMKLDFIKYAEFRYEYFQNQEDLLDEIISALEHEDETKLMRLYELHKDKLSEIDALIVEDLISTELGEYKKSIGITMELIEKFPETYIGYLLQSLTYFILTEYENASTILRQGIKQCADNISLKCQDAQIKLRKGITEKVLKKLNDLLDSYTDDPLVIRLKAMLYIMKMHGDMDAFKDPEEMIEIRAPYELEFIILKAMLYCINNKYTQVEDVILNDFPLNILKKKPKTDTSALLVLLYSYIAQGKFDEALEVVQNIGNLYPTHSKYHLMKALADGYNIIYKFDPDKAIYEEFITNIDEAVSTETNSYNIARYLQFKSHVQLSLKGYQEGIQTLDEAIQYDPNISDLHLTKITNLVSSDQTQKALALIEQRIKDFPEVKLNLLRMKHFIYYRMKKYDKAIEILDELSDEYGETSFVLNNRAVIYANIAKMENDKFYQAEALKSAEKLIEMAPDVGNFRDSYGEVLMMDQQYEEAIEQYRRALELEPTGWFAFQTCLKMGQCYKELKNYEKALYYFERGKELTERMLPEYQELYGHKANRYIKEIEEIRENS